MLMEGPHWRRQWRAALVTRALDRKSTRLNSSHGYISYAVFCLKKKKTTTHPAPATLLFLPLRAEFLRYHALVLAFDEHLHICLILAAQQRTSERADIGHNDCVH